MDQLEYLTCKSKHKCLRQLKCVVELFEAHESRLAEIERALHISYDNKLGVAQVELTRQCGELVCDAEKLVKHIDMLDSTLEKSVPQLTESNLKKLDDFEKQLEGVDAQLAEPDITDDECDGEETVCTMATDDARQLIKTIKPEVLIGEWSVDKVECSDCIKKQCKEFKKHKKMREKELKKQEKERSKLQKKILEEEQKALKMKIKNLKKGRAVDMGIDTSKQEELKRKLKDMASGEGKGNFNINLYV